MIIVEQYIVGQKLRRDKKKKKLLFWFIIILVVASLGFLYITNSKTVDALLNFHTYKIKYGTYSIDFSSDFPSSLKTNISNNLDKVMLNDLHRFKDVDSDADISIQTSQSDGSTAILTNTLVPVGHMYSLKDSTDTEDLKNMNVYVLNDAYIALLKDQYGITAQQIDNVTDLVSKMAESDNNVGLIDFSDIDSQMKILTVNSKYYLDDPTAGIPVSIYASVKNSDDSFIFDTLTKNLSDLVSSYDKAKLLKLNMTGTTALTRALGAEMDKLGNYEYPAEDIASFLADADLTHVSNEISLVSNCVQVDSMSFCANPKSIQTLQLSGVDIVELTGNHNNDYGSDADTNTINTYTSLGMKYFGGGLNADDASKILYEDVKGTKVAFIGYNYYDTMLNDGAIATSSHAGANSWSETKMENDIAMAKANADVVIVDFQYQECYCYPDSDVIYPPCYKPISNPDQESFFRNAIDKGANIVIGTQAHQPQTYELYNGGTIFYGLGNLFFDQNEWIGTRQGMILTHYFYNGKYIMTKITPTMIDMDLQTEFATQEEGDQLMQLLKTAREGL